MLPEGVPEVVSQIIDVRLWWEGNGLRFVLHRSPLQRQTKLFSSHTTAKTGMEFKGYFLCVFLRGVIFESERGRMTFCQ